MPDSVLLTDSDSGDIRNAVASLPGWRLERLETDALVQAIGRRAGVRAVLVTTANPSLLRRAVERAHDTGYPVIVGGLDDTARRRAMELRAEEWYRTPAPPEEIAARVPGALGRGP